MIGQLSIAASIEDLTVNAPVAAKQIITQLIQELIKTGVVSNWGSFTGKEIAGAIKK